MSHLHPVGGGGRMRLDNSASKIFKECPLKFFERYEAKFPDSQAVGLELANESADGRLFGSRMHELLHEYRAKLAGKPIAEFAPCASSAIESEAQICFAAYQAAYPVEPFEVIEAEQTRVVPLPGGKHELVVKLDALVRSKAHGCLQVLDTKTQSRASSNNDPEHWAARPQVSLYLYAARILYPTEEVSDEIILDLIRRQSPKGQAGPEFHRDSPRRSEHQIDKAVRDICWVADQIESMRASGYYPAFEDACKMGNWKCSYYNLHVIEGAREDLLKRYFKPAEPYLEVQE